MASNLGNCSSQEAGYSVERTANCYDIYCGRPSKFTTWPPAWALGAFSDCSLVVKGTAEMVLHGNKSLNHHILNEISRRI